MSDPFAPGLLTRLPAPPRRVVIVRASRIGDFICATPALRALRAALPAATITLVALPFIRELAARSPHIDHFAPFPGFVGIAEQFFDARRTLAFFARLQAEQFDLAVQLHGSGVYANPFTLMLGARVTAGFVRAADWADGLDAALPLPTAGHEVQRVLALPIFLGAPAQGETTEFPLWPADRAASAALLDGAARPLIGLHPGARDAIKRWPPERLAQVGEVLWRVHGGTLVVVGGPDEQAAADLVARQVRAPCRNLCGQTSLPVLGAVIERLALLVTNDSGPAHIAYALGTPTVTIFGGTDPAQWGPRAATRGRAVAQPVPCRPCGLASCPIGYRCLDAVTVEHVTTAAREVIQGVGSGQ